MAKKVRVYELARELGINSADCVKLCQSMGVSVTSSSSSMEEQHAYRVRLKARKENLIPAQESAKPKSSSAKKAASAKASAKAPKPPAKVPPKPRAIRQRPAAAPKPARKVSEPSAKPSTSRPEKPPGRSQEVAARSQVSVKAETDAASEQISSTGMAPTPQLSKAAPKQVEHPSPEPEAPAQPETPPAVSERPEAAAKEVLGQAGSDSREQKEQEQDQKQEKQQKEQSATRRVVTSSGASLTRSSSPPESRTQPPATPPSVAAAGSSRTPRIPPLPGPLRSASGKPIPPPPPLRKPLARPPAREPGAHTRATARRPSSVAGPPGRSGPAPPAAKPGQGRGQGRPGSQGARPHPQRRRKGRRRRRSVEELRPVDLPDYTPDDAPVPKGEIIVERNSTPQELAAKLNRTTADVVRFLLQNGEVVTATQPLAEEMIELYAEELGANVQLVDRGQEHEVALAALLAVDRSKSGEPQPRPPVVTIMGHVDHGKTKLLDQVRNANVADAEAGGITQHIGAYQVQRNGRSITFIDTPGHEAFTAMRARGAEATDIVVLVVAADDGVMPQTVEAIAHARAAEVPIVVAVNKIDKEDAEPTRVLQQLAEHNLIAESWGGDTVTVEVSALENIGVDELLENILVVAEVAELDAYPTGPAEGVVLESHLDAGSGPLSTLLVQNGLLKVGDPVVAGSSWGRVRSLTNDLGQRIADAAPGTPARVLGLSEVAVAGTSFAVATCDKVASKVANERGYWQRLAGLGRDVSIFAGGGGLEDIFDEIKTGAKANLKLILKTDANGSLEAIRDSLMKAEREDVSISFVHTGVGAITENDIALAKTTGAIIVGFNIRPDRNARALAEKEEVEIRVYEVIYQIIEDLEKAQLGLLTPTVEEEITGEAEVRKVFRIKGVGAVAGCYVREGKIDRGALVRFLREGAVIWNGEISSLRRFKDDVAEVRSGFECGIGLEGFSDLRSGDIIETYTERETLPT